MLSIHVNLNKMFHFGVLSYTEQAQGWVMYTGVSNLVCAVSEFTAW